jgi:branched-chain amino acid transport system substrate-binding protein
VGLGGAALLNLVGCGGSSGGGDNAPLKIGALLSLTGTFAQPAESIRNGIDLYFSQNNNKIGNRPVQVQYEDEEGNPQTALRKYQQLVTRDQVNILVGPISSAVLAALVDPIMSDKIVLIDANAAANDVSWTKKSDYIYRVSFSNWQNGTAGASYIAENVGKSAFIIAPDYPAGHEVMDAFKPAFTAAGGKIVKEAYPKLGTSDFATYLTDMTQANPQLVFAFLPGNDGIAFVKQYKDFGLKGKIPLTSTLEFGDPLVIQQTGDAAEGIISSVFYAPALDNKVNKDFVAAYQKKYNKLPDAFAVDGYDSAQVIAKAVQQAKSIKTEDLVKVLKAGVSFDSPRGTVSLDPKTNNPVENFYVVRNVKKGDAVTTETLKTIDKWTMPEKPPG